MEEQRPGISALTGLAVVVIIIAAAFYVSIPMVSSGFTATTASVTSSSSSSSSNSGSSSGTLTISSKQPLMVAPDVNESVPLKFVAIGTVSGNFSLTATSLPKGISATFQPSTVNLPAQLTSTVTMTLSAVTGAAQGNSTVNVVATAGSSVFTLALPLQSVGALVLIQGNAFVPSSVTVASGTKVYWLNLDANGGGDVNSAGHDVTATDGSFTSGTGNLHQYDVYSFTFTKAGTFKYQSAAQPTMTGQVVVTG